MNAPRIRSSSGHQAASSTAAGELVVLCAGNNYDAVKVADRHLAERLARDVQVLYVDPPLSMLTPFRRSNSDLARALERPRLRQVDDGFWRLTPVVPPFPTRAWMHGTTQLMARRILSRSVASLGLSVRAVISAWPDLDIFGVCGEQVRVWWAQDDFAAAAEFIGRSGRRLMAGELVRAEQSDVVIALTPDVADRLRSNGQDVELIPNGCDLGSFAAVGSVEPADGITLSPPIAILVGQLNERVDPALLDAVAEGGVSLLLVGPEARSGASWLRGLLERPNVQWVGGQPFSALPALFAHAAVGLVPYADTQFNRASFPLKLLEYLAAGLPVVSSDLPAARWLAAPEDYVAIASGAPEFASATALAAGRSRTRAPGELRAFAANHSWERRATDVLATIERYRLRHPDLDGRPQLAR